MRDGQADVRPSLPRYAVGLKKRASYDEDDTSSRRRSSSKCTTSIQHRRQTLHAYCTSMLALYEYRCFVILCGFNKYNERRERSDDDERTTTKRRSKGSSGREGEAPPRCC